MKTFIKFLCGTVLSLLFLFAFTSCFNIAHYVSFYCEGAKVTSPVIVRDGGKVSVPNINMEREGHEFVGWFDENGRPFDFENTIIYSHIRIYAVYTVNRYSVTIDGKTNEYDYGTNVKLEFLPDTEEAVFDAYYDTQNRRYNYWIEVKEDVVLTSRFLNRISILLDADGGECNVSQIDAVDTKQIGELPIPSKEGYDFSCWLYNNKKFEDNSTINAQDDFTIKAYYVPKGSTYLYYPEGNGLALFSMKSTTNEVVIPDYIEGKPVVKLCSTLFNKIELSELVIPETVEVMEDDLLMNQANLHKLTLKSYDNTSLNRLFNEKYLSSKTDEDILNVYLNSIDKKCGNFFDINSGYDIYLTISGNNNCINEGALNKLKGIKKLILEEGVTTIDANAFRSCGLIDELYLPSSIKVIKTNAFWSDNILKIYIKI